ncbi:MAG: hypothetical protein ABSH51_22685 [Solirubrobacteraceae bacterium]
MGAISCPLLVVDGLGPQAHARGVDFGDLAGSPITTPHIVSGKLYVIVVLIATGGLATIPNTTRPVQWKLRLCLFRGMTGMIVAIFSRRQISRTSQIAPAKAQSGLYRATHAARRPSVRCASRIGALSVNTARLDYAAFNPDRGCVTAGAMN